MAAALGLVLRAESGVAVVRPVHAAGFEHLHRVIQVRVERLFEWLLALAKRFRSPARSHVSGVLHGDRVVAHHGHDVCNHVAGAAGLWRLAGNESAGAGRQSQPGKRHRDWRFDGDCNVLLCALFAVDVAGDFNGAPESSSSLDRLDDPIFKTERNLATGTAGEKPGQPGGHQLADFSGDYFVCRSDLDSGVTGGAGCSAKSATADRRDPCFNSDWQCGIPAGRAKLVAEKTRGDLACRLLGGKLAAARAGVVV